jgi:hypothetical protein
MELLGKSRSWSSWSLFRVAQAVVAVVEHRNRSAATAAVAGKAAARKLLAGNFEEDRSISRRRLFGVVEGGL